MGYTYQLLFLFLANIILVRAILVADSVIEAQTGLRLNICGKMNTMLDNVHDLVC